MKTKSTIALALAFSLAALASCTQSTKSETTTPTTTEAAKVNYISVDSLFSVAENSIGEPIAVQGLVEHVCKHSGKRFKIISPNSNREIRIELGENFENVEPSIVGQTAYITGKLVGVPYDAKMVEEWIVKVRENHKGEENTDHFKEEIAEIESILAKIKSGEIPHYITYHIEAEKYVIGALN